MKPTLLLVACMAVLATACGDGNGDYDASGVFETTEVVVSARGSGEILRLDAEEGTDVRAGQTVGQIDTVQLSLKKAELEATLRATDSRRYDVARQTASIVQQLATERRERQRYERLVNDNAANRKQLDDIDAHIATLERQLAAQRETLEKGNSAAGAQAQAIAAQLAQIEDRIGKCAIVSPVGGTILAKYAERGEMAADGRSLFMVADLTRMHLRAYVDAPLLTRLKVGQSVKVYADEGESGRREYKGTIEWISDKAEFTPKTIQTRDERANLVYAVKVAVKNDGYIKRGMYGEVKF